MTQRRLAGGSGGSGEAAGAGRRPRAEPAQLAADESIAPAAPRRQDATFPDDSTTFNTLPVEASLFIIQWVNRR